MKAAKIKSNKRLQDTALLSITPLQFCVSSILNCVSHLDKLKSLWQKFFLLTLPILFLLLLSSCSPESCYEETNAFLKVSFYKSTTGKLTAPDSLTLFGLGMETNKLYDKTAGVQRAFFPLNSGTDNCVFIIRINGISDTITLSYSSYPHLISKECGYSFYHTLETLTTTHHIIVTDSIMKRNITTLNGENIHIYY
jgi:hypothetical protein